VNLKIFERESVAGFFIIMLLLLVTVCSLGTAEIKNEKAQEESGVKDPGTKRIIISVSQLLDAPEKYAEKEIVVVGMFMGYDGACERPAPMRGNNWMIQDDTGACIYARGMWPEGCSARPRMGLGKNVAVEGILRNYKGRYFLISTLGRKIMEKRREEAKEAFREKSKNDYGKEELYIVSDIQNNASMLEKKTFLVKGIYSINNNCNYPAPPDREEVWALEDLAGGCIYVTGPVVSVAGAEPDPGALVVLRASLEYYEEEGEEINFLLNESTESTDSDVVENTKPVETVTEE